ncbi:DUF1365 family protein [Guyparkeria halophila]|uniref:DUF1365 family protein n=1 Tax=Guyparkeria halophila TaxID=47960 RepID=A0A6I6CWH2_9GAMM|nr:DUF1365 domain-containing protein [Guyparkeria halophila]QGT77660.1 DUF1365 family protein [Guyparkeria halophila]
MTSALYQGWVMHQRFTRARYRFRYRVFSLLVDLDDLEAGFPDQRLLSHNRFNLFSVHDRDHGPRRDMPLRDWITATAHAQGIDIEGGRILVSAYPRVLGYQFNPLTVWYCHDRSGELVAIDCEVSNTFGGHHHYFLHDHGRPLEKPFRAQADKVFHVSPFLPMNMRYHFRLSRPGERLGVAIRETELDRDGGETLTLVATHNAQRRELTDRRLMLEALRIPFLTFKVIGLIHWQALKIWLKGGRFHKSPPPPASEVSSCPLSRHET